MDTIFQFMVSGGIGRIERKVKDTAEETVQFNIVHLLVLQGFPDMHLFESAVLVIRYSVRAAPKMQKRSGNKPRTCNS